MLKHLERIAVLIAGVLLLGTLEVAYEHSRDMPTPTVRSVQATRTTASSAIQLPDTGAALPATDQAPLPLASHRYPRPEEIVRLPRQIQDQVAGTVLTPAPLFSPAELLTLPWQIQDQVRQVQLRPAN